MGKFIQVVDAFGRVWLFKDVATAVAGTAAGAALIAAGATWLFTPASPFDIVVVAALCSTAFGFAAYRISQRVENRRQAICEGPSDPPTLRPPIKIRRPRSPDGKPIGFRSRGGRNVTFDNCVAEGFEHAFVLENEDGATVRNSRAIASRRDEFETLQQVSKRLLEATIKNGIGRLIMASSNTPSEKLDWMGLWITETKGVPVYGIRPPLSIREKISIDEVKRLIVAGGASELQNKYSPHEIVWHSLAIKEDDLVASWEMLCAPL